MSKTLREIGIDCLGVDPFLKKIGLDGRMTVDELRLRLTVSGDAMAAYHSGAMDARTRLGRTTKELIEAMK